jgi:hypothetical protein
MALRVRRSSAGQAIGHAVEAVLVLDVIVDVDHGPCHSERSKRSAGNGGSAGRSISANSKRERAETFLGTAPNGELVSVKVLKPDCSTERGASEIEAMKRPDHPNIIALDELSEFEHAGTKYVYLVEGFMGGGTLDDRLKSPFSIEMKCSHLATSL